MLGLPLAGLLILGIDGEHHFSTLPYYAEGGTHGDVEAGGPASVTSFVSLIKSGRTMPLNRESLEGTVWLAAFYSTQADPTLPK